MAKKRTKLKKGDVFSSLKEVAEFLNYSDSLKGSQVKQFEKKLSALCEWHKEGRKVIIDKVFDVRNTIPVVADARSIFKDDLVYLIVNEMSHKKIDNNGVIMCSKNDLFTVLGMVNEDYRMNYRNVSEYAERSNIPFECATDLFNNCQSKMLSHVRSALNSLKSIDYIYWNLDIIVATDEGERFADDYEKNFILNAKNKAKEDLNLKGRSYYSIKKSGKYGEFIKKVSEYTEEIGIHYSYEGFKIIVSTDFKAILLSERQKDNYSESYKDKLIESMKEYADKKQEETYKKIQEIIDGVEKTPLNPRGYLKPSQETEVLFLSEKAGIDNDPYNITQWINDNIKK